MFFLGLLIGILIGYILKKCPKSINKIDDERKFYVFYEQMYPKGRKK